MANLVIFFCLFQCLQKTASLLCPSRCKCKTLNSQREIDCSGVGFTNLKVDGETTDEYVWALFLSGNYLESLKGTGLSKIFPQLSYLDLNKNKFQEITNSTFTSMTKLTVLLMHGNKIDEIAEDAFQDQGKLERLDLSDNRLTAVRSEWFKPMVQLEYVYLDNNKIAYFVPTSFKWPLTLTSLSLRNNSFKIMPPLPTRQGYTMYLGNNKIDCRCKSHDGTRVSKGTIVEGCPEFAELVQNLELCRLPTAEGEFIEAEKGLLVQCIGIGIPLQMLC